MAIDPKAIFAKAETFIWTNGRLLERRLFAFYFKDGSAEAVKRALLAFQNADGGFGNALEPDIRCPDSQPVPCQHALEILDEVGWDDGIAQQICDFLLTITTTEGGVPWVLPSVEAYPHAPWWRPEVDRKSGKLLASINPTGILCSLLHKNNFKHRWLDEATKFCWRVIEGPLPDGMHNAGAILDFLQYAPDRPRAEGQLKRHVQALLDSALVAGTEDDGYVWKPLDWAPNPDDLLRNHFSAARVQSHLNQILAEQREDGGWPISFPAFSPACELEWRGWQTANRLKMLKANNFFDEG